MFVTFLSDCGLFSNLLDFMPLFFSFTYDRIVLNWLSSLFLLFIIILYLLHIVLSTCLKTVQSYSGLGKSYLQYDLYFYFFLLIFGKTSPLGKLDSLNNSVIHITIMVIHKMITVKAPWYRYSAGLAPTWYAMLHLGMLSLGYYLIM